MAASKDLNKIFKALDDQGFKVTLTKGSHYKIYGPDGRLVTVTGGTPSDGRSNKNFLAALRRAGFSWPH